MDTWTLNFTVDTCQTKSAYFNPWATLEQGANAIHLTIYYVVFL